VSRAIQYVRCPCCGKLSRGQNFGQALLPVGHLAEIATQEFTGGGNAGPGHGFRWTRRAVGVRDLTFLRHLVRVLDMARARLVSLVAMLERQARTEVAVPMVAGSAIPMLRRQDSSLQSAQTVDMDEREETPLLVNEVRFA
jgi:hypothetical protein